MIEKDMHSALRDVGVERYVQEQLKAVGELRYVCSDRQMSDTERLAVLMVEVGEVATEVLKVCGEKYDRRMTLSNSGHVDSEKAERQIRLAMRAKLAEVAAVAVAWMESIKVEDGEGGSFCPFCNCFGEQI